mmetsp:Transcript_35502/g.80086  ORF Transcript_35502/g.80086 Transcript_35502/m.80086 type:complete len:225 (-) Transcript_35502:1141-1815(-)
MSRVCRRPWRRRLMSEAGMVNRKGEQSIGSGKIVAVAVAQHLDVAAHQAPEALLAEALCIHPSIAYRIRHLGSDRRRHQCVGSQSEAAGYGRLEMASGISACRTSRRTSRRDHGARRGSRQCGLPCGGLATTRHCRSLKCIGSAVRFGWEPNHHSRPARSASKLTGYAHKQNQHRSRRCGSGHNRGTVKDAEADNCPSVNPGAHCCHNHPQRWRRKNGQQKNWK